MAGFAVVEAELLAAKQAIEDVQALLVEAYNAWWPGIVGATLSLSQEEADLSSFPVADKFWYDVGRPVVLMAQATIVQLGKWPDELDRAIEDYRTSDTASTSAFSHHDDGL